MSNVIHSIEITIDRNCDDRECDCDVGRYRAVILAHKKHLTSVSDEVRFHDVNVLTEWLKDAVDAWC
jgi:hypothetical protein